MNVNLLSEIQKHNCIPKPPSLMSGWTRHMDSVSWSDQLDVLSAVSKAGCASLLESQNAEHMLTDTHLSIYNASCHIIFICYYCTMLLARLPTLSFISFIKNSQNSMWNTAFFPTLMFPTKTDTLFSLNIANHLLLVIASQS